MPGNLISAIARSSGVIPTADFLLAVRRGLIEDAFLVHKFGQNDNVTTTTFEDVWAAGGVLEYLRIAESMEIVSDNVNDTSEGVGARKILVDGVGGNGNFELLSEEVVLDGITPVLTTQPFIRVTRIKVLSCGTYGGSNHGNITVKANTSRSVQSFVKAGYGQTTGTHYTIPAGYTGYMMQIDMTINTGRSVDIALIQRDNANAIVEPFTAERSIHHWKGVGSTVSEKIEAEHEFKEKTDLRFDVASIESAQVSVNYVLLLIRDPV